MIVRYVNNAVNIKGGIVEVPHSYVGKDVHVYLADEQEETVVVPWRELVVECEDGFERSLAGLATYRGRTFKDVVQLENGALICSLPMRLPEMAHTAFWQGRAVRVDLTGLEEALVPKKKSWREWTNLTEWNPDSLECAWQEGTTYISWLDADSKALYDWTGFPDACRAELLRRKLEPFTVEEMRAEIERRGE